MLINLRNPRFSTNMNDRWAVTLLTDRMKVRTSSESPR